MANSKDFVTAMSNFTDSLDEIVDILKKRNDNEFEQLFSDTKDQTKAALNIVQSIKDLNTDNKKIKSDTKEILKLVKSIKQTKANSKLKPITDLGGTNKETLKQGASSIVIMASSILALGVAFKLVGEVDFKSVAALGIAIPMIGYTFGELAKNKDLNPLKATSIAVSTVIMAGAIAVSGFILSNMPTMSLSSGLSTIAVAGSMGIAMYALAKAANGIGGFDAVKVGLLASAMPLVAAGLVGAGYFINNIKPIGMEQGLTAIAIAGAMGLAMYGVSKAASSMNGSAISSVVGMSAVMPLIAAGLVASGFFLQKMPTIANPLDLVINSVAVAGSIAAVGLGIKGLIALGLDKNPSGVAIGAGLMPIISAGLMASSWVLSVGEYTKGPSVEWAKSFGLSMLAAVPAVTILGAIAATGVGALVITAGIASMLGIAGGLAAVSQIVKTGDYTKGPSIEWAKGTGTSLMYFVQAMGEASPGVVDLLTGTSIKDKINGIKDTATAMIVVANELAKSKASFTNGPSASWALGTGTALIMFIKAMNDVSEGKLDGFIKGFIGGNNKQKFKTITDIAKLMVDVNLALSLSGSNFEAGPKKEWSEGTATSIMSFAKAINDVDGTGGVFDTIGKLFTGDKNETIINLAKTIAESSIEVAKGDYSSSIKEEWGTGLAGAITAISNIGDLTGDINESLESVKLIGLNLPLITNVMRGLNTSIGGGQSVSKTATDVEKLANAYLTLASAISSITSAVSGVDNINVNNNKIKSVLSKINAVKNDASTQIITGNQPNVNRSDLSTNIILPNQSQVNANEVINSVENKNTVLANPFENMEESILQTIQESVSSIEDSNDMESMTSPISH